MNFNVKKQQSAVSLVFTLGVVMCKLDTEYFIHVYILYYKWGFIF